MKPGSLPASDATNTNNLKFTAMKNLSELLSFGNRKLPKTTAIFNLSPAAVCPSEKLGLCALCGVCYAKKAERLYPACLPYRQQQMNYWLNTNSVQFASEIITMNAKRKNKINALRFNESGDFHSQDCVDKMEDIAKMLQQSDIVCYVYTARKDLDFSNCLYLQVNASGFESKGISAQFIGIKNAKQAAIEYRLATGKKAAVCCGDCKKCDLCQHVKNTVIFCEMH